MIYDRAFPFDTQECLMELGVPAQYVRMVKMVGSNIDFLGSPELAQFEVRGLTRFMNDPTPRPQVIKWDVLDKRDDLVQFVVVFRRMVLYHILTVYIPSSCLLAITIFTTYIDQKHFEALRHQWATAILEIIIGVN